MLKARGCPPHQALYTAVCTKIGRATGEGDERAAKAPPHSARTAPHRRAPAVCAAWGRCPRSRGREMGFGLTAGWLLTPAQLCFKMALQLSLGIAVAYYAVMFTTGGGVI